MVSVSSLGSNDTVEQEDEMRRGDSELTCGTWEIVIADPDDPKFDLEAYLTLKEAAEAK